MEILEQTMNTIQGTIKNWNDWPRIARALVDKIKPMVLEGHEIGFSFYLARTQAQNRLQHSCYIDLARDCLLNGQKASAADWKEVMKAAFYEATKNDPEFAEDWKTRRPKVITNLFGDATLYVPTESKRFTKAMAIAYITFIHATGDERGVKWSKTSLGREWSNV